MRLRKENSAIGVLQLSPPMNVIDSFGDGTSVSPAREVRRIPSVSSRSLGARVRNIVNAHRDRADPFASFTRWNLRARADVSFKLKDAAIA